MTAVPLTADTVAHLDTVAHQGSLVPVTNEAQLQVSSWIQVLAHLDPKYGGVSSAVPQLSEAVARTRDFNVRLAGFCERGENFPLPSMPGLIVDHFPLTRRDWNASAQRKLSTWVEEAAGLHIHGLWQRSTSLTAKLAQRAGKPYIISAHGMLEPWALANKRWKKRIYLALVESKNLRQAACLHALTEAEAQDYRRLGLHNPIAVIPNGVHVSRQSSPGEFLSHFPALAGKRLILFLGRIHFKKGLDILCKAWSHLAPVWPDTQLVLAGPDFEGTQTKVEQLIHQLGIRNRVTFTGMLKADMKWSALAASEFFVLPSYSEGLSVSVLEAMGVGKPVVITDKCNLPEVQSQACGTVTQANTAAVEEAIDSMLHCTAEARQAMGQAGRDLVSTRYSWAAIGKQTASLYQWLGGGSYPSGVRLIREGSPR